MKQIPPLHYFDPIRMDKVEALSARPIFDELFDEIVAQPLAAQPVEVGFRNAERSEFSLATGTPRRREWVALGVVVLLAVGLSIALTTGGGLTGPTTTPYRAARSLPAGSHASPGGAAGSWQLVGEVFHSAWQENTSGPPPGTLTCPTTTACYALAGQFSSSSANATLLSESLYVSNDFGTSWSVLPVPSGFSRTTSLSCSDELTCAAGGMLNGQPILVTTTDGGSQWTMTPLNGLSGELIQLSCSSASNCHGIVGPSWVTRQPIGTYLRAVKSGELPNESFVTTTDEGVNWSSSPLASSALADDFACADASDCVVMGAQNLTQTSPPDASYFVQTTVDGGTTWTAGTLPAGFDLDPYSQLSCSDSTHCLVLGRIPVDEPNPPQCAQSSGGPPTKLPTPTTTPSTAVQAVAGPAGALATQTNDASAASNGAFSCSPGGLGSVDDIAATTNGGLTWTPEALPANVPEPSLSNLACASSTVCWASGSEAVPITVGSASDGGSAVLLGTTDGGTTWSKVTVPKNAPNYEGQSYQSIGSISCPEPNACIAFGAVAQGSPSTPVYTLTSAPGT